jgi:hypothetical protein
VFALVSIVLGGLAVGGGVENRLRAVERNFFGVLRVYDSSPGASGAERSNAIVLRKFYHGTTIHGIQKIAPDPETSPLGYYFPKGPLNDVMTLQPWKDVGGIGMGTAGIVCYQAPRRHYTYYEIDPAVPLLAEAWFGFMRACGTPDVKIGDGRKLLETGKGIRHDLLIIDAFTSDSIPVHLLTREAFQLYFSRLRENGVVLVHISNRFYDLRVPLRNIANALGFSVLTRTYRPSEQDRLALAASSQWAALAVDEATLAPLRSKGWVDLPAPRGRIWTDDYSNLLTALKWAF